MSEVAAMWKRRAAVSLAALTFLATGCGDDAQPVAIGNSGSEISDPGTSPPPTGPFRTDVTVQSASEVTSPSGEVGIEFEARLVTESSGNESVELRFTSGLPEGVELWGVMLNDRLTTRTNHIGGAVLSIDISHFVGRHDPVNVAVIAEDADRNAVAESAEVQLREAPGEE